MDSDIFAGTALGNSKWGAAKGGAGTKGILGTFGSAMTGAGRGGSTDFGAGGAGVVTVGGCGVAMVCTKLGSGMNASISGNFLIPGCRIV